MQNKSARIRGSQTAKLCTQFWQDNCNLAPPSQPRQNVKHELRETWTTVRLTLTKIDHEENFSLESHNTDTIPINSFLLLLHICPTFDVQCCVLQQQSFSSFCQWQQQNDCVNSASSTLFAFHQIHHTCHTWMTQLSSTSCRNDAQRHVDRHIQMAQNQQWLFSWMPRFVWANVRNEVEWHSGVHMLLHLKTAICHQVKTDSHPMRCKQFQLALSEMDAVLTHLLILVLNHEQTVPLCYLSISSPKRTLCLTYEWMIGGANELTSLLYISTYYTTNDPKIAQDDCLAAKRTAANNGMITWMWRELFGGPWHKTRRDNGIKFCKSYC